MAAARQEKVLVAGGGVAGLETVLALQTLAPGRFDITMLAPERHFTYNPLAFGVPLPRYAPARLELASIARDLGFHLIRDAVERVDVEPHEVITQDGARVAYDVLVLTLGARPTAAVQGAIPFRGSQDVTAVTDALRTLGPGPARVAYIVRSLSMWSLPAYELALYTAAWAARKDVAVDVLLVTAEDEPLQAFGREASERVAGLLESSGIAFVSSVVDRIEAGLLRGDMAASIPIDLGVALPYLVGRAVPGLPHDANDFTPVNEFGEVDGVTDVYAIGDMTNRSLKQDRFSAQQADVAAAAIAGVDDPGVRTGSYSPVLRAELLNGRSPLYLHHHPAENGSSMSDAGVAASWWPTHRFAGAHLAPYLGTHGDLQPAA